jgi:hypothetical protein
LKASNAEAFDLFGESVAISGDTILVGAASEDSNATGVNGNQADNSSFLSGAAYVFVRTGTSWTQQAYLKASNNGARDVFGASVAIWGNTIVVGANQEGSDATGVNGDEASNLSVNSGAAYVFARSGSTWKQQAYLKASNTGTTDFFGYAVAVSSDTVVVGARQEDSRATGIDGNQADDGAPDAGAAYVFTRTAGLWTQQAFVKAPVTATSAGDYFGASVAVSGDTVVVGAWGEDSSVTGVNGNQADDGALDAGAAYVFVRTPGGTTWTQQAYLKATNTGANDQFGISVAISGDTVVVGAYYEDSSATGVNGNPSSNTSADSGAAYVYVRSGTTWTAQAYLKASNTGLGDGFGDSVAISGDTIVVGAFGEDGNASGVNGNQLSNLSPDSGSAYVFTRSGTTWTQQAYLKASNPGVNDRFGISVALSGDTIVVGAYYEDSSATGVNGAGADESASDAGAAYVFNRSGTTWTQQAYLKASNTSGSDFFGYSVAISGDTVVVSAEGEDSNATGVNGNQADNSASSSGAAYIFVRSPGGTTWTQQAYLKASNTGVNDVFGRDVAISGDTVVAGASDESSNATGVNGNQADNSAGGSGAAYVFVRSGTTWTQQAYLKASNTESNDSFGLSVAVSGDTVVVGTQFEASNATGVNGNQADNSATGSGAAYVFVLPLPTPTSPLASPVIVCTGVPAALSVSNPGSGIVIDWFTGSCGGTLVGTGNPFNVNPIATTTYFARARRLSDGNTSDACASVTLTVRDPADPACCPCPADFDASDGTPDAGDIDAFFLAWLNGDPTADTDCSGGTPDAGDVDAFFVAWLAGGC